MAILRANRLRGYSNIPNAAIRDKRLKMKDKGLLCFLLSLPDNWEFSVEGLVVAMGTDGKDAVSSGLKRLEECGYLSRYRERDENGVLRNAIWTVSDYPSYGNQPTENPQPKPEKPTQENPAQVNPAQSNNILNNIPIPYYSNISNYNIETNIKTERNNYLTEGDFEVFWEEYPRKVGKKEAKRVFLKLTGVTLGTLLNALEQQKRSIQWNSDGGKYIPHPSTWLNQERWEDELPEDDGRSGRALGVLSKLYQEETESTQIEQKANNTDYRNPQFHLPDGVSGNDRG